jgi:hypothetical protein
MREPSRSQAEDRGGFVQLFFVACWGLLVLGALEGCRGEARKAPPGATSASVKLAPLAAPTWLGKLELEGFAPARVALPLGATTPRPLVIALHGDADRPEWPCGSYLHAARARAFVLCPEGVRRPPDRFQLGSVQQTGRELRAALPALKARYGAHVSKGAVVLAALGPSVEHAIELAREEPSFFAYLVLIDGSLERLTLPIVTRFAEGGGKRVIFVCTRVGCDERVAGKALALRSAGVDARVERVAQAAALDGRTTDALRQVWDWLLAGDPRWR